jgi:cytochrome b561
MSQRPSVTRTYNAVAKILHWAIALLIVAQFVIAFLMPDVHKETKPVGLIGWHVSVGVMILLLALVRVIWRVVRPPVTTGTEDGMQKRIAAITHGLLYLGMLVIPVLGWANANWREWVVGVCSGFSLPSILSHDVSWGHDLGDIHGLLAWGLLALIGLHVAAGLYHQIVLKDDTLSRMR